MAYTLLDLQTSVLDDLKDPSFSVSRITRYLNYAQLAIFNTHMFRFCEKTVTGPLTVSSYAYLQQTDHQVTISGVLIDATATSRRFIMDETSYLPHRDFFAQYPDPSLNTSGIPAYWTEFGDQIYFDRPADKTYTFKQRYYRMPTSMSLPTDVPIVPESFRELLELFADSRAEKYRGNHDIGALYMQQFQDDLESMSLRYSGAVQIGPVRLRSNRIRINE